jgi:hypothetical protein
MAIKLEAKCINTVIYINNYSLYRSINYISIKLYEDYMKKALKICILLLMVSLIPASPVEAWSVNTHYDIVDATYYSLPSDVQAKLNLSIMRDASDDPDIKFLDFSFHSYPKSEIKANYWLKRGEESYKLGNYDDASYCFGVASHYISDSYCAPHTEGNASEVYHSLYETEAMFLIPEVTYLNEDLNSILLQGQLEGKENWDIWIKIEYINESVNQYKNESVNQSINESINHSINKSMNYIHDNLNKAASASYTSIYDRVT